MKTTLHAGFRFTLISTSNVHVFFISTQRYDIWYRYKLLCSHKLWGGWNKNKRTRTLFGYWQVGVPGTKKDTHKKNVETTTNPDYSLIQQFLEVSTVRGHPQGRTNGMFLRFLVFVHWGLSIGLRSKPRGFQLNKVHAQQHNTTCIYSTPCFCFDPHIPDFIMFILHQQQQLVINSRYHNSLIIAPPSSTLRWRHPAGIHEPTNWYPKDDLTTVHHWVLGHAHRDRWSISWLLASWTRKYLLSGTWFYLRAFPWRGDMLPEGLQ